MSTTAHLTRQEFVQVQSALKKAKKLGFRVITGSMVPLIPVGSLAEVEEITCDLQKFDIIIFFTGQILMCHYVLHVNSLPSPRGYKTAVTRGLNSGEDFPVEFDHILGIVINPTFSRWWRIYLGLRKLLPYREPKNGEFDLPGS